MTPFIFYFYLVEVNEIGSGIQLSAGPGLDDG